MKKTKIFSLLFSSAFLILSSCNKDIDFSPVIDVKTPLQNQSFAYGDTIFVRAEIQDKIPIVSVSVSLVNSAKAEVSPQQIKAFDQKLINTYNEIVLDNLQLESGQYYIHIIARNESNSKSYFHPIQISGIQRVWNGLFIITKSSSQGLDVLFMDTIGIVSPFLNVNGDYLNSDINNKYQRLVICGSKTGDLSAVNLETKNIAWSVSNQSSLDNPYFYSLFVNSDRVFCGLRNSEIRSYDFSGTLAYSYSLSGQRYAENILVTSDRVYAQTTDVLGGIKRLIQFYTGSSLSITDHTIPMEIKSWFWQDGKLLVFANTGNTGRIYFYNYINNSFTLLNNTPSAIVCATPFLSPNYFVVCTDGVYVYNSSSANSLHNVISKTGILNMVFDSQIQKIFIQKSNQLQIYSYPDYQKTFEYNSSNEIVNLHLWYNK